MHRLSISHRKLQASSFNFREYVVNLNSFCETENREFHLSQVTLDFHLTYFLDRAQQDLEDSLPRINQHQFQTLTSALNLINIHRHMQLLLIPPVG